MIPYNICENKWLSKAKKHYDNNKTLYIGYFYISVMALFVLALLTAISSFY